MNFWQKLDIYLIFYLVNIENIPGAFYLLDFFEYLKLNDLGIW